MRLILFAASLLLIHMPQAPTAQMASVEGIVVKIGTGEPVIRAQVVLSGVNGGATGSLKTATDGSGKFVVRNILPGRYRILATRDGYIPAEYGQRSPGGSGRAVTVVAGQDLKDIGLLLTPAGTISGRVYDRDGDPVVNANAQVLVYKYANGQRVLGSVQSAPTNDLGEYRLYWLQPGRYIVAVSPPPTVRLDSSSVVRVPGPGGPLGPLLPSNSADVSRLWGIAPSSEIALPVYYPGTTDSRAATPIDLLPGAAYSGVDLTIVSVHAVHIRGRVTNGATGQPPRNGVVTLVPRTLVVSGSVPQSNTRTTSSGEFDFESVAPGSYDLLSIVTEPGASGRLTARIPVEVGSTDVDNLPLILQPGFTLEGRLLIDGQPSAEIPNAPNLTIGLRFDPPVGGPGTAPNSAIIDPTDGTFLSANIVPGNYQVTLGNLPRNWYIKSALIDGTDVLNSGLRIEGQPRGTMDIQVSRNAGTFDATVRDDTQEPASNVMIVLVPDLARRQRSEAYRNALTDEAGHVHFEGVAPGDYKAFAWEGVGIGAWQDPDFMTTYEDCGRPVHISESGTASSELRLITASQ
jgi:hypothetical protein